MKKLTTVDLFAGAGGLSHGFEQTGRFDVKVAVEINKYARETYLENHKNIKLMYDDIKKMNYAKILHDFEEVDVVIGGPPCQGFSNANRQRNELISGNNQLVREYIEAIEKLKPKAFIMENVKAMSSNKHKFFYSQDDLEEIADLGVELNIEEFSIGQATLLTERFISLFLDGVDLIPYILPNELFIKFNGILRYRNNVEKLLGYVRKNDKYFRKIQDKWELLWGNSIDGVHLSLFNRVKTVLNLCLQPNGNYAELVKQINIIVDAQKVLLKLTEIKKYNIEVNNLRIDQSNVLLRVKTYNVFNFICKKLKSLGYIVESGVLNAAQFGVPQYRERLFIIGVKEGYLKSEFVSLPDPIFTRDNEYYTIHEAIGDIENIVPDIEINQAPKAKNTVNLLSPLQKYLNDVDYINNHIMTNNKEVALKRFKRLKQGENFHDLDDDFKTTYSDPSRTQNTIYQRLRYHAPSGTVLNVRKSMWIHPIMDRSISIREAARIQSFPDSFTFKGTKDSQYQQIGNAVPPLLGRAVAEKLLELLGIEHEEKLSSIIKKRQNTLS